MTEVQREQARLLSRAALDRVRARAWQAVPADFGSLQPDPTPLPPGFPVVTTVPPRYSTTKCLVTGDPPGFWQGYMGEYYIFHALRTAFPRYRESDKIKWVSGNGMQGGHGQRERLVDFVVVSDKHSFDC